MDKKTEKRYEKIKKDQERLEDEILKKNKELEILRAEEEEIAGQEILAVCKDKKISLLDAIKIFTEGKRVEKKEEKAFFKENKENENYGN